MRCPQSRQDGMQPASHPTAPCPWPTTPSQQPGRRRVGLENIQRWTALFGLTAPLAQQRSFRSPSVRLKRNRVSSLSFSYVLLHCLSPSDLPGVAYTHDQAHNSNQNGEADKDLPDEL